jgi:hypothetical protein
MPSVREIERMLGSQFSQFDARLPLPEDLLCPLRNGFVEWGVKKCLY